MNENCRWILLACGEDKTEDGLAISTGSEGSSERRGREQPRRLQMSEPESNLLLSSTSLPILSKMSNMESTPVDQIKPVSIPSQSRLSSLPTSPRFRFIKTWLLASLTSNYSRYTTNTLSITHIPHPPSSNSSRQVLGSIDPHSHLKSHFLLETDSTPSFLSL